MGWRRYYPQYNLSPGRPALLLHMLNGKLQSDYLIWGYRTPNEAAAKRKSWINARVEKALTGRYFRHMFREGRVIVLAAAGLNGQSRKEKSSLGIQPKG